MAAIVLVHGIAPGATLGQIARKRMAPRHGWRSGSGGLPGDRRPDLAGSARAGLHRNPHGVLRSPFPPARGAEYRGGGAVARADGTGGAVVPGVAASGRDAVLERRAATDCDRRVERSPSRPCPPAARSPLGCTGRLEETGPPPLVRPVGQRCCRAIRFARTVAGNPLPDRRPGPPSTSRRSSAI